MFGQKSNDASGIRLRCATRKVYVSGIVHDPNILWPVGGVEDPSCLVDRGEFVLRAGDDEKRSADVADPLHKIEVAAVEAEDTFAQPDRQASKSSRRLCDAQGQPVAEGKSA